MKNARQSKSPAIFFTAQDDNVVPARFQKMIIEAYKGPKTAIEMPGASHNDGLNRQAQEALIQFINSRL